MNEYTKLESIFIRFDTYGANKSNNNYNNKHNSSLSLLLMSSEAGGIWCCEHRMGMTILTSYPRHSSISVSVIQAIRSALVAFIHATLNSCSHLGGANAIGWPVCLAARLVGHSVCRLTVPLPLSYSSSGQYRAANSATLTIPCPRNALL